MTPETNRKQNSGRLNLLKSCYEFLKSEKFFQVTILPFNSGLISHREVEAILYMYLRHDLVTRRWTTILAFNIPYKNREIQVQ